MVLPLTQKPMTTGRSWKPRPQSVQSSMRLLVPVSASDYEVDRPISTTRKPDQIYYWSAEWQDKEQASRADILAGRVTVLRSEADIRQHFGHIMEKARQKRGRRGSRG